MSSLEDLARLLAEATQGEWRRYDVSIYGSDGREIGEIASTPDARLIVAMHEALPRLLAVVRAAVEYEAASRAGREAEPLDYASTSARFEASWRAVLEAASAFREGGER